MPRETWSPLTGPSRLSEPARRISSPARARLALLALCLAAYAARLASLAYQSLWRDEVDSVRFALRPLAELMGMFTTPGDNGPLFFLSLRPWLAVAGQSEFALRFPAAWAGVLAVPLTYALARRLLSLARRPARTLSLSNVPLVAALFIACNPYLLWYSQEGKMYALLVALVLAVHLAFLAALERGRWWRWLLYLALLAACALTHVLALLVAALHIAWFALLWPASRPRLASFAACLLLPTIPYFALAGWWQARLFLSPGFQTGHAFVPLEGITGALLTGFSRGVATPAGLWVLTPIIFLLLVGAVMGGSPERAETAGLGNAAGPRLAHAGRRVSLMLAAWLLWPPLAVYAVSLSKPLFTDRYLIWIAPAFAILLAQGVAELARTWRPAGWAALALVVALNLHAGWRQSHLRIKSDFRAAAAYVEQRRQPGDRLLFLIPYSRYTYEYYAGPASDWADGPYTNNGNPPDQVGQEISQAVAGAPAVWLVASEEALWDGRGLVRGWLESRGRRTDGAAFARVEVLRYALSEVAP